jgi:hypothetical protein
VLHLFVMKMLVIYRPNSEFASSIETFVRDFQRVHEEIGQRIEMIDVDSRDGAATLSLYDIMQHPAIMILGDDGQLAASWVGATLPLMDEVAASFYTAQSN